MLGCQPSGGILLTPVSSNQRLRETELARDSGAFVTDKIVVIDVEGMLLNAACGPMFGPRENPVSLFAEKLDKASGDRNVRALLVRINSPGGTVAASDMMHQQLAAFQCARPDVAVAAMILDLGCSGGYYLACAAPRIYATPSSLTGSIGVIFQTFSVEGLFNKLGITTEPIKSGANKDLASPLRERNAEELKILQGIIDSYYETFINVVIAGRGGKVTREALLAGDAPLADGRVFTGVQARQLGLIDELLYPEEVVARLKAEAGVSRARLVIYNRPLGHKGSIYAGSDLPSSAGGNSPVTNVFNIDLSAILPTQSPRFMYLWTGPK